MFADGRTIEMLSDDKSVGMLSMVVYFECFLW